MYKVRIGEAPLPHPLQRNDDSPSDGNAESPSATRTATLPLMQPPHRSSRVSELTSPQQPDNPAQKKGSFLLSLLTNNVTPPQPVDYERHVIVRFLSTWWSNLMAIACIAGFFTIAAFALSLADNYRCVGGGEYVVRGGESAASVASSRCRGDTQHAMKDIVSLNGAAPYAIGQVLVVPDSGG